MKNIIAGNRIFIAAVIISFAWHIFWLSAVKIVVVPGKAGHVKFSKVSFLGPLLERGGMEVRVEPLERSFLEKRYRRRIEERNLKLNNGEEVLAKEYTGRENGHVLSDEEGMKGLIDKSLSGRKLEPGYNYIADHP